MIKLLAQPLKIDVNGQLLQHQQQTQLHQVHVLHILVHQIKLPMVFVEDI
jgi:hypothetical protein